MTGKTWLLKQQTEISVACQNKPCFASRAVRCRTIGSTSHCCVFIIRYSNVIFSSENSVLFLHNTVISGRWINATWQWSSCGALRCPTWLPKESGAAKRREWEWRGSADGSSPAPELRTTGLLGGCGLQKPTSLNLNSICKCWDLFSVSGSWENNCFFVTFWRL